MEPTPERDEVTGKTEKLEEVIVNVEPAHAEQKSLLRELLSVVIPLGVVVLALSLLFIVFPFFVMPMLQPTKNMSLRLVLSERPQGNKVQVVLQNDNDVPVNARLFQDNLEVWSGTIGGRGQQFYNVQGIPPSTSSFQMEVNGRYAGTLGYTFPQESIHLMGFEIEIHTHDDSPKYAWFVDSSEPNKTLNAVRLNLVGEGNLYYGDLGPGKFYTTYSTPGARGSRFPIKGTVDLSVGNASVGSMTYTLP